jgi:glyoxylase-like metal-dependent hydrolase (beta-lactamase superfamily II)
MRALAVHHDAVVVQSAIYQTTCTLVRAGDEGFVIDSPILPDEIEALPALAEQAGFPVSGLLVTHADWDHMLARLAFPEASLGAGEATAERLAAEPGATQRELRAFDEENYTEGRRPLSLAGVQSLPVPGKLALGESAEIELHPAPGHTADGTAFWLPWLELLVCGDYLSPIEIPTMNEGGAAGPYLETLARLEPLVAQAVTVIPGHGRPIGRDDAQRILAEDRRYLEALVAGDNPPLPDERRSATQRRLHADNLKRRG